MHAVGWGEGPRALVAPVKATLIGEGDMKRFKKQRRND